MEPSLPPPSEETLGVEFLRHKLEAALFGRAAPVHVGRYAVRGRLGQGGMGVVYEAYDPQLDRRVAIKVLRRQQTFDERGRARLAREAKTMAKLAHPHVVEIFEVGEHGGELFVAMELVDGVSLSQWLETPRTVEEVCQLFIGAAEGLAAVHAVGVVHRDFKPQNVLVDRRGEAKVTDFGLARQVEREATDSRASPRISSSGSAAALTQTGALLGTPHFMSPEQHRGLPVGPKSDQWNFCVALHEALHGRLPFSGHTVEEVRAAVEAQRIEPGDRDVPAWLDTIIRRGLQLDPDHRFGSMDELSAALRRGRKRIAWWAGLPVAGLLAAVATLALGKEDPRCEGAAAHLDEIWNEARRTEIEAILEPGHEALGVLDRYAASWIEAHTLACQVHRDLGADDDVRFDATMRCLRRRRAVFSAFIDVLADGHASADAATRALAPVERCRDEDYLAQQMPVPDDPQLAAEFEELRDELARAEVRRLTADHPGARAVLDPVIDRLRGGPHSNLLAQALITRGRVTDAAEEATRFLDEGYRAAEGAGNWPLAYEAATTLVYAVGGGLEQHDEGLRWAAFARAARRRQGLEPDQNLLTAEGMVLEGRGSLDEAEQRYRAALETVEALAEPEAVRFAAPHHFLGALLVVQGRPDEALIHLRHAHRVLAREFGSDNMKAAHSEAAIGDALRAGGDPSAALEHHRHALDVILTSLGPDHPSTAGYQSQLAQTLSDLGRYDAALEYALAARKTAERAFGPQHPNLGMADALVGVLLTALERYEEAIAHLERAQATFDAALPAGHRAIAENRERLAVAYARGGTDTPQ